MSPADLPVFLAAFTAGVTTFFAPCSFPLLQGYVGYYVGTVDNDRPLRGAVVRGMAGSVGIGVVFATVGLVAVVVGRTMVQRIAVIEPVIGLAVIGLGALMLSGRMSTIHVRLPYRSSTVFGFGLFGAAYALAAAGCFGPVFLAIVLQAATISPPAGVALTIIYAAGMAVPFVAATAAVAVGRDVTARSVPASPSTVRRFAGVVILASGVVQTYNSVALLASA